MKRLYISDLDGTLLNNQAALAPAAAKLLQQAIGKGALFSVATARTAVTVAKLLERVPVNVPAIVMNGAAIFDLQKKQYVQVNAISAVEEVVDAFGDVTPFMYQAQGHGVTAYYTEIRSEWQRLFMEERRDIYQKPFVQLSSLKEQTKQIVYFSTSGPRKQLEPVYQRLLAIDQVRSEFYHDIYHSDIWYLEVLSAAASKEQGVRFLKQTYGFDEVVGFGDNLNDLPLCAACDRFYAVNNAKEKVKEAADGILLSNEENGVPHFLYNQFF